MKLILKIIAKIRLWLEPLTWKLWGIKNPDKYSDLGSWDECKDLDIYEFSNYINKLPYEWDKLRGFLDCSLPFDKPQIFFKNISSCRDCDDFARIWSIYCQYHNIGCKEWIITDRKHPFTKSHFVTVMKCDTGYRLLNYRASNNVYKSEEEVFKDLEDYYPSDIRLQCKYKEYKV